MKYVILIPIYNDRESLKLLVENINSQIKNGINIPICFSKKISGYLMWSNKIDFSRPVLANP